MFSFHERLGFFLNAVEKLSLVLFSVENICVTDPGVSNPEGFISDTNPTLQAIPNSKTRQSKKIVRHVYR
jgi:hypothetical protein